MIDRGYLGNPLLKGAGVPISFTPDQVTEWIKCADDPIYFIENYVKIVTLDEGLKLMELYEFQKDIVRSLWKNRKTVGVCARQMGKCHHKDTKYTIRNKRTGEVYEITAEEFHETRKRILSH